MFQNLTKHLIRAAVRSDSGWRCINATLVTAGNYARAERQKFRDEDRLAFLEQQRRCAERISPSLAVMHGPFQGLRYPDAISTSGAFLPRLLGCYERELHPIVEQICQNQYSEIIDIGSAEGYYAIGLARRISLSIIHAFDTDPAARAMCRRMAEINGVENRVKIGEFCSPQTLAEFQFNGRGLIICDCEGYERTLFSRETAKILENCDVLVELHDFVDISISERVLDAFSRTHKVVLVESVDDLRKVKTYQYPELNSFDFKEKLQILSEYRGGLMEWAFFTPLGRLNPAMSG